MLDSKWTQIAAGLALIWFLTLTWGVLSDYSYVGFFLMASANGATHLMFVDLAIGLTVLSIWMVVDGRREGNSYLPPVLITLLFGVAGPLLYLVMRPLRRAWQRGVGLALLAALCFAAGTTWNLADLRNVAVEEQGSEERGRALLLRAAEQHGLAAWEAHTTLETTAVDSWAGGGPWWPSDPQRFRSETLLGTFTSRVELLSGASAGEVWGLQTWSPYRDAGTGVRFVEGAAPEIEFYLPTLQYFQELPFRLLEADVVRDAGRTELFGAGYQRVFVTWHRADAHEEHDQYVLWIGEESGLIEMVRYTVRDGVGLAPPGQEGLYGAVGRGTMHYSDYREVDGVMLAFRQTVVLPPPELTPHDVERRYFHQLEIETAAFDTVGRAALIPEPERGAPGDRKRGPDS